MKVTSRFVFWEFFWNKDWNDYAQSCCCCWTVIYFTLLIITRLKACRCNSESIKNKCKLKCKIKGFWLVIMTSNLARYFLFITQLMLGSTNLSHRGIVFAHFCTILFASPGVVALFRPGTEFQVQAMRLEASKGWPGTGWQTK